MLHLAAVTYEVIRGKVFFGEKAVGGRKGQPTERGGGGREELLGEFAYLQGRTKVGRRRKERHPSGGGRRTKGLIYLFH